jgi:hypothetical protein
MVTASKNMLAVTYCVNTKYYKLIPFVTIG